VSRDAKNSIFSVFFVCSFFGALYVASTLENRARQIAIPLVITIMFGFAKRYVLGTNEQGRSHD
jgi:hypothetical protein